MKTTKKIIFSNKIIKVYRAKEGIVVLIGGYAFFHMGKQIYFDSGEMEENNIKLYLGDKEILIPILKDSLFEKKICFVTAYKKEIRRQLFK